VQAHIKRDTRLHDCVRGGECNNTHGRRGKCVQNFDAEVRREEREHSEDLGVGGKMLLEWILGKLGGKV